MNNNITDLVLLVGTNPLPNYVVSKYLLGLNDELKSIWLVYSEKRKEIGQAGTVEFAENIKEVLKKEFWGRELTFETVALGDIGSANQIKNDLEKKFYSKIINRNPNIHLNYTGGTKSMAVHVYRYIENNFKKRSSFSYLDGRRYKLLWDNNRNVSGDLRKVIILSLSNLIELHGYVKKKEEEILSLDYYPVLDKFEILINSDGLTEYLSWKDKQIRGKYYAGDKFATLRGFLNNLSKNNNQNINKLDINAAKQKFKKETHPLIFDLLLTIPREKSILEEDGSLWIPDSTVTNKIFKERLKTTVSDFLDGKWLEQYVFNVIDRGLQKDTALKDGFSKGKISIDSNWRIKRSDQVKDFELDVILVNGYQICGISCTTSNKEGVCKQKGFEIIHRTRQMGGDEALSILVTCLNDGSKNVFSADLEQMTGATNKNLLVLGQAELKAGFLWEKIRNYIWGGV